MRKELIRLLDESMPEVELETATLDAETADPLAEILAQVGEGQDPVMVLGLERAVPMGSDDAPVLRALNLARAEWRERLRRPVAFWIPESLLGALGRTAPDFLDWRSDTLHFAIEAGRIERELMAFDTSLWQEGLDRRMSERDRRARVEELRSRLRLTTATDDPRVAETRGSWFFELGNHLLFFGDLKAAQQLYEQSATMAKELGYRPGLSASYHQLGRVAQERGLYEEALELYSKSLAIEEDLGSRTGIAYIYHRLGIVAQDRGSVEEALEWYRKSLAIKEELGNQRGMASSYHQLGSLAQMEGHYEESLEWYRKSLAISEALGNLGDMAASYHQLGRVAHEQGSYEEAMEWYGRSLGISEELGRVERVASNSSQIGVLLTETGRAEEAVRWNLRALSVRLEIGMPEVVIDLGFMRRQREILGEERFRELVEEHAESPEMAATVLKVTAETADEPVQDGARTLTDARVGGHSDGGA